MRATKAQGVDRRKTAPFAWGLAAPKSLFWGIVAAALVGILPAGFPGLGSRHVLAAEDGSPLQQAASLRSAGQFDEALEVLRVESREIKRIEGDASPRLMAVNDLAAEILVDQGALAKAVELLDKTIALREKLIATGRVDQNTGLGGSLLTRSRLEALEKRYPEAAESCRLAMLAFDAGAGPGTDEVRRGQEAVASSLERLDDLLGPTAEQTRQARERAAETFESLGMLQAAVAQRKLLCEAAAVLAPPDGDEVLRESGLLARAMLREGRATEAAAMQARTIDEWVSPQERTSVAAIEAATLLGELFIASDAYVLTGDTVRQAWESVIAAKKESSRVGIRVRLLGLLAEARAGHATELPDWFAAAVNALGRGSPAEAAAGVEGLLLAATIRDELGATGSTRSTLEQALAIAQAAKPPMPELVAAASARLATALAASGDIPAARKLLDKAVPAAEAALGPGDPGRMGLEVALIDVLVRQADPAAARSLAARLLDRGLPRPSNRQEVEHVAVFDRLADKANTDDLDFRERFIEARARQFGEEHPFVAAACQFFGAARLAAGDWPRAIALLTRAAESQQRVLAEDDPELAATLLLLGHAQRAAGVDSEAIESLTRSRSIWSRAVGDDHPGTLAAMEALAVAKAAAGKKAEAEVLLAAIVESDALGRGGDSIAKASHLVRLGDLLAAHDKPHGQECLEAAAALPCWSNDSVRDPRETRRLAKVAALASHAYGLLGERDAATAMLRRGRQLAVELGDPKPLLDELEQIAAQGDPRPKRR